jgi:DNA-binding IclR family transcriptional regulator
MSTTPAAALERREGILRFVLEADHPVAAGEIREALNLSEHATRSALRRLVEDRELIRAGTGRASRYKPMPSAPGSRAAAPVRLKQGTAQGIVLATIEDRGFASLEELRQATRLPEQEVLAICGGLIREGEIEMDRRNDRPVYIRKGDS